MKTASTQRSAERIGIIALVPDDWHGPWMSRHHIVGRLASHFDVVWVEPAAGWRDYWLPGSAPESELQAIHPEDFGLTVYAPGRWLPELYHPRALGGWVRRQRVIRARRLLERRGCTQIVLYLWRPNFDWALDAIKADLTCYHIVDEYSFSMQDMPNDPSEITLIQRVDQVIIHSRKLLERKGGFNPHTMHVPNGVDYKAFSTSMPEPADIARIPRPRMGYVGIIKSQLDLDLLNRLAKRHPEWSFVLVGPQGYLGQKIDILKQLEAQPNVYLPGNRQLAELPACMQAMDVCLMCYEVCDYTHYIYPLKLNEYLATGRPIVSTPIDSVRPLGHLVGIAGNLEEWSLSLTDALSARANAAPAVSARQQYAALHDWDHLVRRVAEQFRSRLN